jgi:hypothetical protein
MGQLPAAQPGYLDRVDVDADDEVTEMGEAGRHDQANIVGADDRDPGGCLLLHHGGVPSVDRAVGCLLRSVAQASTKSAQQSVAGHATIPNNSQVRNQSVTNA